MLHRPTILAIKGTKEGTVFAQVSEPEVEVKLGVRVHSKIMLLIRIVLVFGKSIVIFWDVLPTVRGLV
jgi:hypothetical protein